MGDVVGGIHGVANQGGHRDPRAGERGIKIDARLCGRHDRVVIAAPREVDGEAGAVGELHRQAPGGQEGRRRHEGNGLHPAVPDLRLGLDKPSRGIEYELGHRLNRVDKARVDQDGDESDGVVPAHRQVPARLDVEDADVRPGVTRWLAARSRT